MNTSRFPLFPQQLPMIDISRESPRAMVAAIQRQLISGKIDEEEVHFYSRCLQHLSVAIGDDFDLDPWTITPYEVEFGAVIGSGMLSVYYPFLWYQI